MSLSRKILLPLIAVIALSASIRPALPWLLGWTDAETPENFVLAYTNALLAANYFDHGFTRRALAGTIARFVGGRSDPENTLFFHVVSAVWLLIPLIILLYRFAARSTWQWLWFGLVLAISPQFFLGWATHIGRTDMLTTGFIAWAVLAVISGSYFSGAIILAFGSLAHETTVIVGMPMLAGVWLIDYRAGKAGISRPLYASVFLGAILITIFVAQRLLGHSPYEIAEAISKREPDFYGPFAAYNTVGGLRSIMTSACFSFARGTFPLFIGSCFVVLFMYFPVLLYTRRSLPIFLLVALLPLTAMSIVAVDYGRWLTMAVMNAWMAALVLRLRSVEPVQAPVRTYVISGLLFAALLSMRSGVYLTANAMIQTVGNEIWAETREKAQKSLDQCDPTWRTAIRPSQ